MGDRVPEPLDGFEADPQVGIAWDRAWQADPQSLSRLANALRDRVVDEPSLVSLLGEAARQAVRLVPGADYAGVTATVDGTAITVAHTDARVLVVDEGQAEDDDGPCLRALRTGRAVRMDQEEVVRTFPRLAATARSAGVHSFLALPLPADLGAGGSLNLYATAHDAIEDHRTDVLTVLAGHLSRGLTDYARLRVAADAATRLRIGLGRRRVVAEATGALMAARGLDAEQALAALLAESRIRVSPLHDTAAALVLELTGHPTEPPER